MRASAAVLLFILLSAGGCAYQRATPAPAGLVGTWRLVEYWNRDSADQPKRYPFGEQPVGFIVYDAAGNVFIQFAPHPRPARMTREELRKAGPEELRATLEGYVAYFGTYTVDAARGVVIHHVAADVRREYTGTDQERPFRLSGDELIIGDQTTWLRRLVRVR